MTKPVGRAPWPARSAAVAVREEPAGIADKEAAEEDHAETESEEDKQPVAILLEQLQVDDGMRVIPLPMAKTMSRTVLAREAAVRIIGGEPNQSFSWPLSRWNSAHAGGDEAEAKEVDLFVTCLFDAPLRCGGLRPCGC